MSVDGFFLLLRIIPFDSYTSTNDVCIYVFYFIPSDFKIDIIP